MEHIADTIADLYEYFDQTNRFAKLGHSDYWRFQNLIAEALTIYPENPMLLFWKGWGHQFFIPTVTTDFRHPEFEWAEDAYSRAATALKKEESGSGTSWDCSPAIFMLAHLYWDAARREQFEQEVRERFPASSDLDGDAFTFYLDETQNKSAKQFYSDIYARSDYSKAKKKWSEFYNIHWATDGLAGSTRIGDGHYAFFDEPYDWICLFEAMRDDIASREQIGGFYHDSAYTLLNYGYGEDADLVQYAFGRVLEYSSHPGMIADAKGYIAANICFIAANTATERSGDEPEIGLQHLSDILDIREDPERYAVAKHHEIFDFCYGNRLKQFLQDSRSFVSQNPRRCLDIIKRAEKLELVEYIPGDADMARLSYFAGQICVDLGRYDDADGYLSFAHTELGNERPVLKALFRTYQHQRRYDEAADMLALISDKTPDENLLCELAGTLRLTQEHADMREEILPRLDRLNEELSAMLALLSHEPDEISQELAKLRASITNSGPNRENSADDIAARISERLTETFGKPGLLYEQARDRCRSTWPEHWTAFPKELQKTIVTAELADQVLSDQQDPDYDLLIFQWGRISEIALRRAFVDPLGKYLDDSRVRTALEYRMKKGKQIDKRFLNKRDRDTWQEFLGDVRYCEMIGLLDAAKHNHEHHVYRFLAIQEYDLHTWLQKIPTQAKSLKEKRNATAHGTPSYSRRKADEVRSICVSGGFLAEIGKALGAQRRRTN